VVKSARVGFANFSALLATLPPNCLLGAPCQIAEVGLLEILENSQYWKILFFLYLQVKGNFLEHSPIFNHLEFNATYNFLVKVLFPGFL
jgi:hypothetical protein